MSYRKLASVARTTLDDMEMLKKEHAQTRGIAMSLVQLVRRGLWGRLKWLLIGK